MLDAKELTSPFISFRLLPRKVKSLVLRRPTYVLKPATAYKRTLAHGAPYLKGRLA